MEDSKITKLKSATWPNVEAPIANKHPHLRSVHGDEVVDNYYWLNDYFKKGDKAEAVIQYLKEENAYTSAMLKGTESFQKKLFNEMKGRIKEADESVPYFENGYYYYKRTDIGKQYYKFCRKKDSLSNPEEILLDVDEMAQDFPYYAVTGFAVSPDNKYLAYGVDTLSRREYVIQIKDLDTGLILEERIANTTGCAVWAADSITIFYTSIHPETLFSEKIKRHAIGETGSPDVVVYDEKDNTNYIGVSKSKNGKYIFIQSQGTLSSECRFIKADMPNSIFEIFQRRQKDVLYSVTVLEDKFLVTTNENAINFKVMTCPLEDVSKEMWKEYVPHRANVLIEDIDEFRDFLVFSEREHGLLHLAIHDLRNNSQYRIDFGESAYTVYPSVNVDYNSTVVRYGYTSLVTPMSTYDYHMLTKEKVLLKQQAVLGGYNSDEYATERVFASASDGMQIPISLVYKKGIQKDGSAPLHLYAYGSYGVSIDPVFSSARLSLLNRGFIFAIAHIRGGEEMGRQWYEDGKLNKKKNTFTDFIACGKYLIHENYTSKGHLYAEGGSAGGLLMGAVINMAPDLWNGVIAAVPFVDVVNTMLDDTIPLTTNEYDEWGNPNDIKAYTYMKSYSPYENIEAKLYPNLLVTTGLHDSQVQYFEPAKWVAKLRTLKKGKHVVLLKTDMDFGHGGASGRFDYLKDQALEYAFLLKLEGVTS